MKLDHSSKTSQVKKDMVNEAGLDGFFTEPSSLVELLDDMNVWR